MHTNKIIYYFCEIISIVMCAISWNMAIFVATNKSEIENLKIWL